MPTYAKALLVNADSSLAQSSRDGLPGSGRPIRSHQVKSRRGACVRLPNSSRYESQRDALAFASSSHTRPRQWPMGQSAGISSPSFVEPGLRLLSIGWTFCSFLFSSLRKPTVPPLRGSEVLCRTLERCLHIPPRCFELTRRSVAALFPGRNDLRRRDFLGGSLGDPRCHCMEPVIR
jgi:hypothetical protein